MKILIEGGDLNPPFNEGTRNIARTYWRELLRKRHKVVVLTRSKETITKKELPKHEKYEGITYYRWRNYLDLIFCLKKIQKNEKIDVIHIFAKSLRPGLYLKLLKMLIRKPIVFSLLGYPFEAGYKAERFEEFVSKIDYLAVSSKTVSEYLRKISPNDKINYISYGVDLKLLKPLKKEKILLCLKNPSDKLLMALSKISRDFPKWKIGFDKFLTENTPEVKKRINYFGIKNIAWIERLPEIYPLLGKAEIAVESHPLSKFLDCASPPLLITEAMACKTKVVSANIPEISEIITLDKEGFLYKKEDSEEIYKTLKKSILSGKGIGNSARDKILEKYNITRQAKKFEKIYIGLI